MQIKGYLLIGFILNVFCLNNPSDEFLIPKNDLRKNESLVESLKKDPLSFVELFAKADPGKINEVISLLEGLATDASSSLNALESHVTNAQNNLDAANKKVVAADQDVETASKNLDQADTDHTNAVTTRQDAGNKQQDAKTQKELADQNYAAQSPALINEQQVLQQVIDKLSPLSTSNSATGPACNEVKLWNCYPCPEGFTRYGDGSACESGSNKCDLGYVAGRPNLLPSCYIEKYEVDKTKMMESDNPWNFYPCPEGLTRYGDGSACESGSNKCDLGYVGGRPNLLPSCYIEKYEVDETKMMGSNKQWNFYPCPPRFTRYGDGSACEYGSQKCDLGYVAGVPNTMDSCATFNAKNSGTYKRHETGQCADIGGTYITDETECRAAAVNVGWPLDNFLVASRGDWPRGCWLNVVGNMARFNTNAGSSEPCSNIDACLCKVG